MPKFTLFIEPVAHTDIQDSISYYNSKEKGLGRKFHSDVKRAFKTISKNAYFQVRYNEVRCLPLEKFPFLVHYKIHQELNAITIYAVIHTSMDTVNWVKY